MTKPTECIHWLETNDDDVAHFANSLPKLKILIFERKFILWKLIKYVNRNLYVYGVIHRFFGTFRMHGKLWKSSYSFGRVIMNKGTFFQPLFISPMLIRRYITRNYRLIHHRASWLQEYYNSVQFASFMLLLCVKSIYLSICFCVNAFNSTDVCTKIGKCQK